MAIEKLYATDYITDIYMSASLSNKAEAFPTINRVLLISSIPYQIVKFYKVTHEFPTVDRVALPFLKFDF